jgi:aminoglycoside phosphotransferase (APT) family kinase protein
VTPSWLETLRRLLPEPSRRHAFRAMALARALPYPRNVTFLIFCDDDEEPSWILRCHRDASIAAREATVLGEMQRRGYRLQPETVSCGACEDLHAQLLRFCKGHHGSVDLWRSPDVVDRLASDLADMQTGLAAWARSTLDTRPPLIRDLCDAAQRASGKVGTGTQLARTLEQAQECLARAGAPALPQHGDCCTANLLWDDGAIRLLDWEHFGSAFEPFLDIWMFALSLCEDSGDPEAASLFAAGANATATECAVRRYAARVGLPAEIGREVFPLALARFIHMNIALGRTEVTRLKCRILDAYLADSSRFMAGLR